MSNYFLLIIKSCLLIVYMYILLRHLFIRTDVIRMTQTLNAYTKPLTGGIVPDIHMKKPNLSISLIAVWSWRVS